MILLILIISLQTHEPQLSKVRALYNAAAFQRDSSVKLSRVMDGIAEEGTPVLRCYKGAASMLEAKFAKDPFSKLAAFGKGKTWIEKAVLADTANLEMRLIRLAIQENLPALLGYKSSVERDRTYLKGHIHEEKDLVLKEAIIKYFTR